MPDECVGKLWTINTGANKIQSIAYVWNDIKFPEKKNVFCDATEYDKG